MLHVQGGEHAIDAREQSSRSDPYSVMSGWTPKASRYAVARMSSTRMPFLRIISVALPIRSKVCDFYSGRLSVLLIKTAERAENPV
ncbi:MAG: hypothetical protein AB7T39_17025 [Alphaproteobacteria bacterium]